MWLDRAITQSLEEFLRAAKSVREAEGIGQSKRDALLQLLCSEEDVGVVTRSAPGAARVKDLLSRTGVDVPVFPVAASPESPHALIVLCSWPGRQSMSRFATRYASPRIHVLTYPFEKPWLSSFAGRWSREWTRYARSREEIERLTGLPMPGEPVKPTPVPSSSGSDDEDDPLTRILNRRRKGGDPVAVPEKDAREAWYVGFHGSGYGYLTEGHKVPVLTALVVGGELPGGRVPLRPVRKLVPGDFVLFRDHGDQDVISALAEYELGSSTYAGLREITDTWRRALRSIGSNPQAVWKRLRNAGLNRRLMTVRAWLTEGERIGPRSERDLRVIAEVSGDEELSNNLERVSAAIGAIRLAHRQAGHTLSDLLLRELPERLPEVDEMGGRVDFAFGGGWVVCVDQIAPSPEERPYWEVNRLLFEEES